MHLRRFVLLLSLVCASRGGAQETTDTLRGWSYGPSLGWPTYQGQGLLKYLILSGNVTYIHVNHLGADFALGIMPIQVDSGFPFAARVGVVLPLKAGSHLLLIPSTGVSGAGGGNARGLPGYAGFHAGVATVVHGSGVGLRMGVSWLYVYPLQRGNVQWRPAMLFELGIVKIPGEPPWRLPF